MILGAPAILPACPGHTRDTVRAQTRNDLAKDLLAKGDTASLSAAETEVKKALGYDPQNEESHNIWGLIELRRALNNQQLVEYADCLTGITGDALRAEADELMRKADAHFARAVALAPDYGEAWQNRGGVALYFRDWDKVIEYEEKALANLTRLTSEAAARMNLGWAHFNKQNLARSVALLLQATQGTQYMCLGNYRLAEVYYANQEFEDAALRLRPIVDDPKLCPPMPTAQYLGGQVFLRLHDAEAAEKAFNQCIALAPKSCQARECEKALSALTQ